MASDSIVWISGASRGIGAALAAAVPYEGARVVDISRSGGAPDAEHLPADLADPASWAAVEGHFLADLEGQPRKRAVFIHNAGVIEPIGFAGEVESEPYRRNVLVNAAAPLALGHAFLRALTKADFAGEAHLVMLTSGAARSPYEGWSGYCAGKAAVDMWVRAVGAEQQRRGDRCRVIAVAPGVVGTAMQERIRATGRADFPRVDKFQELHRKGQLRDPAEAAQGIWRLLDRKLDNGSIVDLRELL